MARTQVQSELLATNSISGTIIADNAITATHIATNAISGTLIQDSGIVTTMIAANNVTATKVVTNAIQTRHIADDQVTEAKLANAINTSIAAKLPLAGGTMTGNLNTSALIHLSSADPIIKFTDTAGGDTFGVFASASNYLGFYNFTDSRTDMVIDGSGNLGIGVTDPDGELHVESAGNADVYVERTSGAKIHLQAQSALGAIGTSSNHDLGLMTNASVRMRITSGGQVGFTDGTASLPSITNVDDLNTGIYFPAADNIGFSVGGTSKAFLSASQFNVTGNGVFSGTMTAANIVVGDKISQGNGELDLYDGGANTVLKNGVTNGNVKIQAIITAVGAGNVIVAGDSALGQVDLPYQSGFMAYSPAVTQGGGNRIIFGSTHHNTGADYNTSNGKFTAPRTGRYFLSASVLINPGSSTTYERILFASNENNGATSFGDTLCIPGNSTYEGLNISGVFYIDAGDTFSVINMGQSPTYGTAYGAFSGFYLG